MKESTMNDKLVKIQKDLKAPKDEFNNFAKFAYRSAEKILEAVKPLVHAEGLHLILTDEVVNVGNANYVKATVAISDGENVIETTAYAREEVSKKGMDSSQITGSTSSYARKYALNGLFAIDDNKDADSQDNEGHVSQRPDYNDYNRSIKVDQIKELMEVSKKASGLATKEDVLAWFADLVGMTMTQVKQTEFDNVKRFIEEERIV